MVKASKADPKQKEKVSKSAQATYEKPETADRAARRLWRANRPRWEADHIVPVADGGGECGLDNYRLLCRPCHLRVTLEWRSSRSQRSTSLQIRARADDRV